MSIGIVDTSLANLASVRAAFAKLEVDATLVHTPEDLGGIDALVLPGVGAFGPGMERLANRGLDAALRTWVVEGKPLLGICLGMQLLTEGSDEAPDVAGLGVVPGVCRRLPDSLVIPHLGWNWVQPETTRLIEPGFAAFANSYVLSESGGKGGTARTGGEQAFVSAYESGRVLACQFHPELSGPWGRQLLRRWLADEPVMTNANGGNVPAMARRIISCLDVRDGRVVKGVQFQNLQDKGDPASLAAAYAEDGADEIVVLDVSATREARLAHGATIASVRARIDVPLTVGGGVDSVETARRLLEAGADKVSVNSAALATPSLLRSLADEFGSQCVVLAVDARARDGAWEALARSGTVGTGRDVVEWAREGVALGAGEILLTSWDRDGTNQGTDLSLVTAVSRAVPVPVIASGGMGTRDQLADAFGAGAHAALAASMFHDGKDSVTAVKRDLRQRGLEMRI